jgi:hypothetical protein
LINTAAKRDNLSQATEVHLKGNYIVHHELSQSAFGRIDSARLPTHINAHQSYNREQNGILRISMLPRKDFP